jgi:hypothetical protein
MLFLPFLKVQALPSFGNAATVVKQTIAESGESGYGTPALKI